MNSKVSKKSDQYKSVFGNRGKGDSASKGVADWSNANPQLLQRLIVVTGARSGAVRFGYTRDGGAYNLGIYLGSESTTEYCRPNEDLDAFLQEWIDFITKLDPFAD